MSSSPFRSQWQVPAALLLFTLFFYWKVLFTDRLMFPWDAADFFYPCFSFVHEELRHFRLPLWDPYVMAGFPIIGDIEAQIFYPINWLFVLVHPFSPLPYRLVEIQLIFHFFLAGLFMYYLARDFVVSKTSALLGAVLFMSSGAMVAHTQHLASINAIAWYPLIFLLARRGLREGRYFLIVSAGMLFGVQILAGHWQHSVYFGLLLFLYFFYEACVGPRRAELWPRWLLMLPVVAGAGAALSLVQVVPAYELGKLSVRSYLSYWDVTLGNEPRYLWTLILPNFFGGLNGIPQWTPYDLFFSYVFLTVPGCLLALAGLATRARRRDFFWLGATLLFVDLSLGRNGHLAAILYRVPVLNLFRNAATFFDVANFVLCLMAAVGAESLFRKDLSPRTRKWLPAALFAALVAATGVGLALGLPWRIPSWSHMLAALTFLTVLLTAMLRNRLSPREAQWAVVGLMVFDLCFYNMNQAISTTEENPRTYLTRDLAAHRSELLQFLRSDVANDFRVAAVAEFMWSGNGWNVWRIPGIYGWNPLTLRRYDQYIRTFTHTSDYTLPYGGPDHDFDSPLFDLLGSKYLLMGDPDMEEKLQLRQSPRFRRVYDLANFWRLYQNRGYVSRGWFYPRAYVVPNQQAALAVMNSHWFDARRTLVFEKEDLRTEWAGLAEELAVIPLRPEGVAAASNGSARPDPFCADRRLMFADWGDQGSWLRYDVTGPPEPGRYLFLVQYTAAGPPSPLLRAEVQREEATFRGEPVPLRRSYDWPCQMTRIAELGEFEMRPGPNLVTIRSERSATVNIYAAWLVRVPPSPSPETGAFSFRNFSVSANRISFDARVERDGFLLLNEIFYPGWEAKVGGKPAEILRSDTIFRTLYLPAGSHRIEMRFRPRYFLWGAAVSLVTLCGFLALAGSQWRKHRSW